LIHLGVDLITTNLAQISYGYRPTGDTTHLDRVTKSKLVINRRFFEVSYLIIYYTKINVREELARYICDFLMLHVVLDGIVHEDRVNIAQFHVVDANAIVRQCLSMHVTYRTAYL